MDESEADAPNQLRCPYPCGLASRRRPESADGSKIDKTQQEAADAILGKSSGDPNREPFDMVYLPAFNIIFMLAALLALLHPAIAGGADNPSGMSDGIPLSDPSFDGGDSSSTNGTDSSSGSSSSGSVGVIGTQPATVQLGSGFIVGCVMGVIMYAAWRLCHKVARSDVVLRIRRRREPDAGDGDNVPALVDV